MVDAAQPKPGKRGPYEIAPLSPKIQTETLPIVRRLLNGGFRADVASTRKNVTLNKPSRK